MKSLLDHSAVDAPLRALLDSMDGVLAVITSVEGPSYRPVGAMMAFLPNGQTVGTLSSGCIEADLALHAKTSLKKSKTMNLRYGLGSPFVDIALPCGGGLNILLIPRPNRKILTKLCAAFAARTASELCIDLENGDMAFKPDLPNKTLKIPIEPEIKFYIFGKGPEAATFASLTTSSGYPTVLLSPDQETLNAGAAAGCETLHLTAPTFPKDAKPDNRSAVVLFFHDHDWEPPLLLHAITTDAFYIGAQGSRRAADLRKLQLSNLGVSKSDLDRIKGPIGLVPSAKDARKLAVSVLAEVLNVA